ncbi:MAG: helix-turn-helix domain-containing protein [Candidatus Pseudobacter hemicellulosilyticus]|uniref:Helix-turn-helix domain-containing protein n=1 Tax=Candidatus Pseudobacter hemicellulosilyticus TaxID=3121375 RepID=A0AAJ6BGA4_9BACT|nr:MAG: helix-turn-helix domain-containing protein [Pseudobacter sp.]
MKATLYQPGPALSRYVDNYMIVDIDWTRDLQEYAVWRLIPFGQTTMLFLFGDPHQYSLLGPQEGMQDTARAFLVGQLTRPIWLKFSGHTRLFKIQFRSAGIRQLLPFNMQELTNVASLELDSIWGNPVQQLLEKLYEAPTDPARVNEVDQFLLQRLSPASNLVDYVDYTIHQLINNGGNLSIQSLEKQLGISSRQLERLFRAKVGLPPKELGRIIRLNQAISRLRQDSSISLFQLSHAAGYFDQAHFSRDFKNIAGVAPSKLFSASASELFVTNGKCFVA